jgi:hypothetical protein
MSTKKARRSSAAKEREDEDARFAAWLEDFDTRHRELVARLDALLYSLGVDPMKHVKRDLTRLY